MLLLNLSKDASNIPSMDQETMQKLIEFDEKITLLLDIIHENELKFGSIEVSNEDQTIKDFQIKVSRLKLIWNDEKKKFNPCKEVYNIMMARNIQTINSQSEAKLGDSNFTVDNESFNNLKKQKQTRMCLEVSELLNSKSEQFFKDKTFQHIDHTKAILYSGNL